MFSFRIFHRGSGLYDYGFRYYMAEIGRFTGVDPLAENHYNLTPYHYVMNNPIMYIDPFGLDTIGFKDHDKFKNYNIDNGDIVAIPELTIVSSRPGAFEIMGREYVKSMKKLGSAFRDVFAINSIQEFEGNKVSDPGSIGKSGSNIEFFSETSLKSNGAIGHPKATNGTDLILTQNDFPALPGAGGAGKPATIWQIKSAFDGADAATNAGAGIRQAQDLYRQKTAVDSFCINGSNCAFGGKPHAGFSYYRVNVFGVRLDTIVNK